MNGLVEELGPHEPNYRCAGSADFELLGHSVEGRPLVVEYCGSPAANVRIFILAGQHGDESEAREAAAAFLVRFRSGALRATARLAILADANPDGAAINARLNALHSDLNRDHLLLCTPETLAIHSFLDRWQPDLVLDVHTYRPWRRELLKHDFVFPHGVMIDFPTNPAVRTPLLLNFRADLLSFVKFRMAQLSIRCDRYTLVRPSGIVRHSNLDILDARNSLALRFDIPTILLEGRRASPDDPPIFTPPNLALLYCLEAVVEWAGRNANMIRKRIPKPDCHNRVPVRCRYSRSTTPRYMEMQSAISGRINMVGIPGDYLPFVKITRSIRAPRAYAVPRNLAGLLELLAKRHFRTTLAGGFKDALTQIYRIEAVSQGSEDELAMPLCTLESAGLSLDDFVLFPTGQCGGPLLALFLEPESQFGPHRIVELAAALRPGSQYPVARVI